jgi:hypothetical protein
MPQGLTPRRVEDGAKIYLISGIWRENEIHNGNFNTTSNVLRRKQNTLLENTIMFHIFHLTILSTAYVV